MLTVTTAACPSGPRWPVLTTRPTELCLLAKKWTGELPAAGAIVQEKIDGIRGVWIEGKLLSREGVPIRGAGHIADRLRALEAAYGCRMFFDGEYQVGGSLPATLAHFGAQGRRGDAGIYHLFDALPLHEWRADASEQPLTARLATLAATMTDCDGSVLVLPSRHLTAPHAVRAFAIEVWSRGGEGAMIKDPRSLYRRRRDGSWLKLKR